jgi:hypothetical protein
MLDIITRLRLLIGARRDDEAVVSACRQAIDEIETLRNQLLDVEYYRNWDWIRSESSTQR